jgi:dsRNA-specific ribonuclease
MSQFMIDRGLSTDSAEMRAPHPTVRRSQELLTFIEERFGCSFHPSPGHLYCALNLFAERGTTTPKAYSDIYEFFGDRVLSLGLADFYAVRVTPGNSNQISKFTTKLRSYTTNQVLGDLLGEQELSHLMEIGLNGYQRACIVEAVFGAIYSQFGMEGTRRAIRQFFSLENTQEQERLYRFEFSSSTLPIFDVSGFEERLGYKFTQEQWLQCSLPRERGRDIYQPFQTLGHEIFQFHVTREIFTNYLGETDGGLSDLRQSLITSRPVVGQWVIKESTEEVQREFSTRVHNPSKKSRWAFNSEQRSADMSQEFLERIIGAVYIDLNRDLEKTCSYLPDVDSLHQILREKRKSATG